jgi:type II secretory pathway component GspD/PulD (secretin)
MALPPRPALRIGVTSLLASALSLFACSTAPQQDPTDTATGPDESTLATTSVVTTATDSLAVDPTVASVSASVEPVVSAAVDDPAGGISQEAEDRWKIKVAQMQMQAEEHCAEGQKALERGDFEKAHLYFEQTLNHIKWAPVGIDWGDLGTRAQAGLENAERAASRKEVADRRDAEERAFEKTEKAEMAEMARRAAVVDGLLLDGIAAFNRREFGEAERIANDVLDIDPTNKRASNLRTTAIEYSRSDFNSQAFESRKDEFRRWKQDIEETRIPYADVLTPPDKDEWRRISELRNSTSFLVLGEGESPLDKELKQRIKNTTIPLIAFPDVPVAEAITHISVQSGIPIVIAPDVASELESGSITLNISQLSNIAVNHLLDIITQQAGEGYTHIVDRGVVRIAKRESITGASVVRIHTVQDIAFKLNSFRAPKIEKILPPGAEISEEEGSPFGSEVAGEAAIAAEDIVNLIKENISRGTWDTGEFSIGLANNDQILVVHTPEVHREVAQFLDDLRKFSGTVVTIESRFVNIRDDFLNEIGVDWRGLGGSSLGTGASLDDTTYGAEDQAGTAVDNNGPGADLGSGLSPVAGAFFNDGSDGDIRAFIENVFTQEKTLGQALSNVGGLALQFSYLDGDQEFNAVVKAIEKSQFTTEVSAPVLTVYNTQRANCNVVNQVSYVQDFDVDVANSAFIANPNVGILQEGVVLDVTPTISFDRRYITLEVRATVANITRPIREFSTSLSGLSIPVTFQLPELIVQQASTTVRVPDGGSLVLGGLKRLRYINRTAEVPWLGRIPVAGVLFREKGLSDETGSLIILIRANITELTAWRESTGVGQVGG